MNQIIPLNKKLKGVKAVQTLSRLNRTCSGKIDIMSALAGVIYREMRKQDSNKQ